jgi:ribosomal-protein-alanine N-acetyltransferase
MFSERLRYDPVTLEDLEAFHKLVQDEHIRRYLMDGKILPKEWSEQRIRDSKGLFERRGVGIWLVYDKTSSELMGFCGFLEIPDIHSEPQLVYALAERFTGQGSATEMARTSIAQARRRGFAEIVAGIDEVNVASLRVLQKLGFGRAEMRQGAFGNMFLFRLVSH